MTGPRPAAASSSIGSPGPWRVKGKIRECRSVEGPRLDEAGAGGEAWVPGGTPTLLIDDPLPMFSPAPSPSLAKEATRNPLMSQGQPPPKPRGDFDALLAAVGLSWTFMGVVWSGTIESLGTFRQPGCSFRQTADPSVQMEPDLRDIDPTP
jgi:hypothetical protein